MVDLAGGGLPREQSKRFWQHSFFAALLSEHLAKRTGYSESEQAYIAGLLHDIGQVPQWMLVSEEKFLANAPPPRTWFDNPPAERDYFGLDHCRLGGEIATSWNLMPSFIDVLSNHHDSEQAEHDPYLTRIVGAVEHFLLTRVQDESGEDKVREPSSGKQAAESDSSHLGVRSSSGYDDSEWQEIAKDLEVEYERLLPVVASGLTSVIS
jgi:putative nucleotidyltransferase with HDIG domain